MNYINKIKILSLLVLVSLAACGKPEKAPAPAPTDSGDTAASAGSPAEQASAQITADYMRDIVVEISDDKYEGRGPGSAGDAAAVSPLSVGADVQGVASFHGLFNQPGNTQGNSITAKVLAMHGWEDPMATPEQVLDFAAEMTGMGADWQLHAFGNTSHAFTNPEANDAEMGLLYQADADRRSWELLAGFLAELFV